MPRSESGRSGVPTRPSFRESSYENEIRKRPYPFRWCGGSVRMHARLYLRRRCEQRRRERARRAHGSVTSVGGGGGRRSGRAGAGASRGVSLLFGGDFLLREVGDGVAAVLVALAHDVEEEGVDVVVERLLG